MPDSVEQDQPTAALDSPDSGSPQDQPSADAIEQGDASGIQAQDDHFYEAPFDDEPVRFKTKEELDSFMRQHAYRDKDYRQKTQGLSEERKKLEQERERFNNEYNEFLQTRQQIQKYNDFLKQNPHIEQQLAQMLKQPQGKGDPRVDELQKKLETWEQERDSEKKKQESEQQRQKAIEAVSKRFPDFNKDEVEKLLGELREMPPGGEAEKFMELLHYANRGKKTPAQIEQEVASREEKNRQAHSPMTPGKQPSGGKKKQFSDIEEARAAAEAAMGGS